jgi:hypothetical protein
MSDLANANSVSLDAVVPDTWSEPEVEERQSHQAQGGVLTGARRCLRWLLHGGRSARSVPRAACDPAELCRLRRVTASSEPGSVTLADCVPEDWD